ncbi:MAG: TldD/PmbA family protein [Opitutus sp.]|nr:TldD/PmbA family protein [Opitutus sp.]
MSLLTESEARTLLKKVLALAKADECSVFLSGARRGNLRFARNNVSTSGGSDTLSLGVNCSFGKKTGAASINEFDDASLARAVRNAEELARLSPDNPEHVELVGPQTYLEPRSFFASTAALTQDDRVRHAAASIKICRDQKLTAAGYLSDSAGFSAIANSRGLFGYQRNTEVDFTITARTDDGRGSGYGVADFDDAAKLDTAAVTSIAARKAVLSQDARAIEPGKYTVVLEPSAGATLIGNMLGAMNARAADEGRTFLSKAGGGTRVGEKLMDERVHLYTDPMNAELPGRKWTAGGLPQHRIEWIEGGVVKNLAYDRFWARKKGIAEDKAAFGGGGGGRRGGGGGTGAIMAGTDTGLDDLIKSVKRGVLVTNLWYIRLVDAQTQLYTGLTRDGTFYIENGAIKYPVKNFRFNESPVIMLNNLEALGRPVRVSNSLIPPMVVRDFTFSSLSDAV